MDITIKTELDGVKIANDYRNMNAGLIVHEIKCLILDGHKIVDIIDLKDDNK